MGDFVKMFLGLILLIFGIPLLLGSVYIFVMIFSILLVNIGGIWLFIFGSIALVAFLLR